MPDSYQLADGSSTLSSGQPAMETRSAPRVPASALPSITGLRLSPHGGSCTLVNISATGLLADCGERVPTGSTVTITFEGTFSPHVLHGHVTRSSVSSMAQGRLRYHVGVAFSAPIALDFGPGALQEEPEEAVAAPPPLQPEAGPGGTAAPPVFNRW